MAFKQSPIYKKIFIIYSLVSILLITCLDIYFTNYAKNNASNQKLYTNQKLVADTYNAINKNYNFSNQIMMNLYKDQHFINDLITFLETDLNLYIQKKLDAFVESNMGSYNGIQKFISNTFESEESLIEFAIVSSSRKEISKFNRQSQIKVEPVSNLDEYEKNKVDVIDNKKNEISYVREIRNPLNLEVKGLVILKFDMRKLKSISNHYDSANGVIILNKNGYVIYDSEDKYEYEFFEKYGDVLARKEKIKLDRKHYMNVIEDESGITIVGKIAVSEASKLNFGFYLALVIIDIFVFSIGQAIIYFRLRKIQSRIDAVVDGMDRVKSGNLNIKINTHGEDDEISYITECFNDMCEELDNYIKISYLAEVNRKNAEMKALQSKINPHFLYNTLEAIRMKAICNGDRDVGRMLYFLANLFRNQLKEKDSIPIKSEVEYCKQYLELFTFRFEDKFIYEINCDKELEEISIIKFILQPLVENYLIHGIKVENNNNKLKIDIFKSENDIEIHIEDNGKGVDRERLRGINNKLKNRDFSGNSIGIINAHERIIIAYGEEYGIKFDENIENGTRVIIRIPCGGKQKDV